MYIFNSKQMRNIDKRAIEKYKIPGMILMENAALAFVDCVKDKDNFLVVCGKGNNGGDGLAIARHLFVRNKKVKVFITDPNSLKLSGDALLNFEMTSRLLHIHSNIDELDNLVGDCDFIIDALLGTGFSGEVSPHYEKIINKFNHKNIISVDIPSGMEADTGKVGKVFVNAKEVITFSNIKTGLLFHDLDVKIKDISIPNQCILEEKPNIFINKPLGLKPRKQDSHKGDYGRVMIVGGSKGFTGAACLAADAALRMGSGLVSVGCAESLNDIFEIKLTECMTLPLPDDNGIINKDALGHILEKNFDALLIGPGLGVNQDTRFLVNAILKNSKKPLVIDADGLNSLDIESLGGSNIILTPHIKEMSRLTGLSIDDIKSDRIGIAKSFALKHNVVLVLKDFRTIITDGNLVYVNLTGNASLAKGGSGDVLAGFILSLTGQGMTAIEAARTAVYIHGLLADYIIKEKNENSVTATDLINYTHSLKSSEMFQ